MEIPAAQDFTPREVPISDYRDHDLGLTPEVFLFSSSFLRALLIDFAKIPGAQRAPPSMGNLYHTSLIPNLNTSSYSLSISFLLSFLLKCQFFHESFVEEEEEENESGSDQPNSVPSDGIPIQKPRKKQSLGMNVSQSVPVAGSDFLKEEKPEPVLSSSINSQPASTAPPMLKPAPLDYQIHKNQAPLHSIVHLGYPTSSSAKCEYGIHSYEIMSPIVLTILTRSSVRLLFHSLFFFANNFLWTDTRDQKT